MSSPYLKLPIKEIKVRNRYRKDLGDLEPLMESIQTVGLLHPIVVDSDHRLIAGTRRLAALKKLGNEFAPCTICYSADDALNALRAERDENTCRLEMSVSERVAIGEAIEKIEKPKADSRESAGISGIPQTPSGNLPEGTPGRTAEKAAEAAGMSRHTYEKAKEVVHAAKADPALNGVVKEMNATGKVAPAHRKVTQPKNGKPKFDDAKITEHIRKFVNLIDERAKSYGKTAAYKDMNDRLEAVANSWKRWRLEKEK